MSLISYPENDYDNAFRPFGLAGTALDGMEPLVGDAGKPRPSLRCCVACEHLCHVRSEFRCRLELVRSLSWVQARRIRVRCTEYQSVLPKERY